MLLSNVKRCRELVAMGFLSRQAHARWFDPIPLMVAMMLLIITACGVGVIASTYAGVTARDVARTPISAEEHEQSQLLYRDVHDFLRSSGEDVSLVYLVPLNDTAPLPPGVEYWPDPGKVLLSPALQVSGEVEGIEARYGEFVGSIGSEGLASPTEKLAYIRPAPGPTDTSNMFEVSGFGEVADEGRLGDAVERQPLWQFNVAFVLTIGLSAVLVAAIAARSGLQQRRAENTSLLTLGYSPFERALWQLGKVWRSLLAGFSVGALVSSVWVLTDVRLPWRNFIVQARDVRSGLAEIIGLVAFAAVVYTMVIIWMSMRQPQVLAHNRPVSEDRPFSFSRAVICVVATPIAVIVMIVINKTGAALLFGLYVLALVTVLFTIGDLLALIVARWAQLVRRQGQSDNDPGKLIGGAGLIDGGFSVVRLAVLITVTIMMTSQIMLLLIARAQSNEEALSAYEDFSGQVVEMNVMPGSRTDNVADVLNAVKVEYPTAGVILTRVDNGSGSTPRVKIALLEGALRDLQEDNLPAFDTLWAYLRYSFPETPAGKFDEVPAATLLSSLATDSENWDLTYSYAVIASENEPIDTAHVKQIVASHSAPMWRTGTPGTSAFAGTTLGVRQASWVGWMGVGALGIVLIGVVMTLVGDAADTGRKLAPTTVLSRSPHVMRRVIVVRVGIPIVIGTVVGLILALMLGSALTMSVGGAVVSLVPFISVACVLAVIAMFCGWCSALLESQRMMMIWKVGSL